MERVGVALSGGVDSAVSAFLLQKQSYDVFGITLKLGDFCGENTIKKARIICDKLKIKHYVIDVEEKFKKYVIDSFVEQINLGFTPVPCVECNKFIKFSILLNFCRDNNAKLATGHYAKIFLNKKSNCYQIKKAKDILKDQTHFLCSIDKQSLKDIIFPLGDFYKSDVFRIAKENDLIDDKKYKESQDVCFFNGKSFNEYVNMLREKELLSIKNTEGNILHIKTNEILGKHNGLLRYTIGQRQGIGVAWSKPLYVIKRDFNKNILYVGEENCLYSDSLKVDNLNIIDNDFLNIESFVCDVCLRDKTPIISAKIEINKKNSQLATIKLAKKARAITNGQWCAMYKNDVLIGGGKIV